MFFYEQNKENQIGNFESLVQNRFGTSFSYAGEKQITLNGEVSFIRINLMGMNFLLLVFKCWSSNRAEYNLEITLAKKNNTVLDVNFNYQGRKSESSQAIHTGNLQLRAYFNSNVN
jgi:hypothetical protein